MERDRGGGGERERRERVTERGGREVERTFQNCISTLTIASKITHNYAIKSLNEVL